MLFDENLPGQLPRLLADLYPDSDGVLRLGLSGPPKLHERFVRRPFDDRADPLVSYPFAIRPRASAHRRPILGVATSLMNHSSTRPPTQDTPATSRMSIHLW